MTHSPAFGPDALKRPLYLGDPERLRAKLNESGGILREYWDDFNRRLLKDPKTRAEMIFLPALVTDDHVEEARALLLDYCRMLTRNDNAGDFQFHTWCRGGSTTRRAAFFDWLASKGAWSPAEIEEAAESFLGFAWKHSFTTLTGRTRSSNNQAISMALNCAVLGFVFGHKLADHPTGKFLFEYGLGRIPDLIGLFPGDGYGGEGSTYTSHVNTPLACWMSAFMRQVTGRDYLDVPFRPNGTTLRRLIEMELHLTSSSGLLAPWDHYGWQKAINGSAYAFLARETGDARYLSLLPALDLWKDPGYLAWGADDPMWILAWWPDALKDFDDRRLPADLFGWFLPNTGASLEDPGRRVRLMQVWDTSAETIAGVGRAQVNPNHLMMDFDGEPVFQDGVPEKGKDPWDYPPDRVLEQLSSVERERFVRYRAGSGVGESALRAVIAGIAPGMIGGANAVVVNREPWYWPGEARVGTAKFHAREQGLQAVTADCESFYRPRFPVTLARRTSLWCEDGFGLVLDTLHAEETLHWQWRLHTRPDVDLEGDSARISLPGGRWVLLAWESVAEVTGEVLEGFPRTEEGRSFRIDLVQKGADALFAVVIAPQARSADVRRTGPCTVEVNVDGKRHRFLVENFRQEKTPGWGRGADACVAWERPDGRVVEIRRGLVRTHRTDTLVLPDIEEDFDIQDAALARAVRWTAKSAGAPGMGLAEVDACLAQLGNGAPDIDRLMAGLHHPRWPVQVAAAEVLGRHGVKEAAPEIRALLEAEHAIPTEQLYPSDEASGGAGAGEAVAKRWRLKAALIVALGRLKDRAAVELLGRILADGRDFYPVYSVAAQALGRIGGPGALEALRPAFDESEVNTRDRAAAARDALNSAG